jgi:hypothetical protein
VCALNNNTKLGLWLGVGGMEGRGCRAMINATYGLYKATLRNPYSSLPGWYLSMTTVQIGAGSN